MSIVRTRPWSEVIAKLDENPYLPLVRFIAESEFSNELHGDVFLSGLLLSDSPDFELGVHMLRVEYIGMDHFRISYLRGRGGFKDETEKVCTGGEIIAALDQFLKVKFGVALMVKNPMDNKWMHTNRRPAFQFRCSVFFWTLDSLSAFVSDGGR